MNRGGSASSFFGRSQGLPAASVFLGGIKRRNETEGQVAGMDDLWWNPLVFFYFGVKLSYKVIELFYNVLVP